MLHLRTVPSSSDRRAARVLLGLAAASVLGCLPGPAHATDGYFLSGVGAKAKGSGGVAIAQPQDALSIAANPAAATEVGERLDVGFEVFVPRRGATISGNGAGLDGSFRGNGTNPFILPELGYVRPLSDKVAVGIAVYGNGGMNTDYRRNPFASFGATGSAGVNLMQMFITPTLAVKVSPGASLGISPIVVLQSFEAKGIAPFSAASADPAHFTNRGNDWAAGGGIRVGYLGKIGDRLTIGAFYQSKIWTGRFRKYAGLFAGRGGFDVPASWGGGAALEISDRLTVAGDVKRIEYSGIASVGTPLSPLFLGKPFGASDGPGFGWRDITVYKLGATYAASDKLTLRAGYGHSGNPVPASETLLNVLAPGVVQDHVTLGATVVVKPGFEVTGYAMHAPRQVVKGNGSIPAPYGGGEADIHLSETSAGLSAGFIF